MLLFIIAAIVFFGATFGRGIVSNLVNSGNGMFLRWQFPVRYQEIVERHSDSMNVNPNLVYAIIKHESNFRANAVSHVGASGLMQLMEDTAKYIAHHHGVLPEFTLNDIFDPDVNIKLGTWYIAHLLNIYNGNLTNALAAYNAGQGNVDRWLRDPSNVSADGSLINIPFGETRRYVERVLHALEIYERLE